MVQNIPLTKRMVILHDIMHFARGFTFTIYYLCMDIGLQYVLDSDHMSSSYSKQYLHIICFHLRFFDWLILLFSPKQRRCFKSGYGGCACQRRTHWLVHYNMDMIVWSASHTIRGICFSSSNRYNFIKIKYYTEVQ